MKGVLNLSKLRFVNNKIFKFEKKLVGWMSFLDRIKNFQVKN